MTTDIDLRYFTDLAAAFVRGRRPDLVVDGLETRPTDSEVVALGIAAGLRLHKFKRNTDLPRVKRVLGALRGILPATLLDVGSGRGTFLWPLLDAFVEMPVTAIDLDPQRASDLDAVRRGGIERLTARQMDAEAPIQKYPRTTRGRTFLSAPRRRAPMVPNMLIRANYLFGDSA